MAAVSRVGDHFRPGVVGVQPTQLDPGTAVPVGGLDDQLVAAGGQVPEQVDRLALVIGAAAIGDQPRPRQVLARQA